MFGFLKKKKKEVIKEEVVIQPSNTAIKFK